jgi:hypothetical protein
MPQSHPIFREVISHWFHLYEGLHQSPREFYQLLEQALASRQIPSAKSEYMEIREGGVWSPKRLYLRIWRADYIFDVCGAPFGNGFFVTWWLSELPSGCMASLTKVPFLNTALWMFVQPVTYFRTDTALMFQETVHQAVLEVMDQITCAQGNRSISQAERRPNMRQFLRPIG